MHTRLAAIMLLVAPLASCKDKDKDKAKTVEGGAPATGSAAAPASPAVQTNDLAMLAADSEVVLGLSWPAVQASMLWTRFALPEITKEKEVMEIVSAIKSRCGIDVQADPKKILMGIKGVADEVPDGAFVIHGLDKAKTMACPSKFEAEAKKEQVVVKTEGDIIIANDADGYGMALTFVGDRALFLIGHQMSASRVKKAISGDGRLASSKAFVDMHGKLDANATVWGLVHGKLIAEEVEGVFPAKPSAVYGTINLGDAIAASVRGRFESPAVAAEVTSKMKPQVEAMAGMVDNAVLAVDGSDVTLAVSAGGAKLQALLENL